MKENPLKAKLDITKIRKRMENIKKFLSDADEKNETNNQHDQEVRKQNKMNKKNLTNFFK